MIMILHMVVAEQFMPFFFVFVGIVGRFFYDYALEAMENGRYRGQATIEMCITTVVGFKAKLSWNYESPRTHIQRDGSLMFRRARPSEEGYTQRYIRQKPSKISKYRAIQQPTVTCRYRVGRLFFALTFSG